MSDLQIVSLKNNLLYDVTVSQIKTKIISRLNELNLTQPKYKTDNEFLVLVCNLIEFLVKKKKDKIVKKELAIGIFTDIFNLNDDEKVTLSNNIDFIHANGTIKKISQWKLFKCGIYELFAKKC
jgi:hypothetical protein